MSQLVSPFETALGAQFNNAPPAVRAAHRSGPVTRLRGVARVQGASSPLAALFARLFGMPGDAEGVPVRVTMRLTPGREVWTRQFGGRRMESRLRAVGPGVVRESFGPFGFDMKVSVADGVLAMTIVGWRLGPIPLPVLAGAALHRDGNPGRRGPLPLRRADRLAADWPAHSLFRLARHRRG